ncbi:MAG: hypothetical protein IPN17_22610 [Deltaproteobacteria bacterium]|nr:hypothetical protein [Deltaproteobacteria bacterium]MBK8694990.1 hypothetical protein [Deltaproteobacteria bacterium]
MNASHTYPRASSRGAGASLLAALLLGAAPAGANGRFPTAQDVVVGPGARSDVIVLRTTFGLVMSRDAGATFHWMCEAQIYRPLFLTGEVDPSIAVAADGSVVYGFPQGIHLSPDGCRVARDPAAMGHHIADLTTDPSGERLFAIESDPGGVNHVLRADARTLLFERLGAGVAGVLFTNLDVAASRPGRLYASGFEAGTRAPRIFRSDDGGATLVPLSPDLGPADDAWLSGVDPTDPEVLYVRSYMGGVSTALLRSADGGAHFTRVASTRGPMLGFALSDDGRTVWIGSAEDGLLRSDDRGLSFVQVSNLPTLCLRQHAGVLWACSDWTRRPFALGRSRDGGRTFEPVVRWADVAGPFTCDPSLMGPIVCGWQWPGLQDQLQRVADAGAGAGAVWEELPPVAFDAGMRGDAGVSSPGGGGCSVGGGRAGSVAVRWCAAGLLAAWLRRRAKSGGRVPERHPGASNPSKE